MYKYGSYGSIFIDVGTYGNVFTEIDKYDNIFTEIEVNMLIHLLWHTHSKIMVVVMVVSH